MLVRELNRGSRQLKGGLR